MQWILLKFALLRGYLILIRFVAVITISILALLFWNTLYMGCDDRV